MLPPSTGYSRSVSLALVLLFGATSVWGQAQPDQTLDQVEAFDSSFVLDMAFVDPSAPEASVPDFTNLGVNAGGGVASCKIAPSGLYCLATVTPGSGTPYQVVRFWADPKAAPLESTDLLRCDDVALGLQVKAGVPGPCTGLTVDLAGAIWVTGSQDGKNYRLLKIDREPAVVNCSSAVWQPLTWPSGTNLCRAVVATGQGVLSDIDAVDADAIIGSAGWISSGYGPVILGVRNTLSVGGGLASDVVMFNRAAPASPATAPSVVFGSWGLAVGERLQSASVLQVPQGSSVAPKNYVLAVTSVLAGTGTGRILARDATASSGSTVAFDIKAWEAGNSGLTINLGYSDWSGSACQGQTTCAILRGSTPVATLTSTGGTMVRKTASSGAVGLGVSGATGTAGEIDFNESIKVAFSSPLKVSTIEVLFLYNGPEFSDKAEIARITADGVDYFLSMRAAIDDDTADWTGPGSVAKCSTATSSGTGCLLIINPFPGPVTNVTFGAANATANPILLPPSGGTNNSDYSIGRIETANYVTRSSWTTGLAYLSDRDYQRVIALGLGTGGSTVPFPLIVAKSTKAPNLDMALSTGSATFPDGISVAPGVPIDLTVDCPTPIDSSGNGGCPVALDANGEPAAKLGNVNLAGTSTASGVTVYKVKGLLDCRYEPLWLDCFKLRYPGSTPPTPPAALQAALMANPDAWIVPVMTSPTDPNRLSPAAQRLNVTPQLPEDVTAGFPLSGPGSLPNLYISQRYRGRDETNYKFDALFFKTEAGVYFTGTYAGEFDVSKLTGFELGCDPSPTGRPKPEYFEWDTITTVSETWIGVGSRYIDTLINVGCRNPTKVIGGRTSLFPILEIAPDTYGPTIKSTTPSVTLNNDGAFARLTQSLYDELRSALDQYTCAQIDSPTGAAPLSPTDCSNLRTIWSAGKPKLDKCVSAAFQPKSSASNENCQAFRVKFDEYKTTLPATPSGTDLANRLAEQYYRWEVIKHVFETRFLPSIPPSGYCRENNKCGNTSLD